MQIVFSQKDIEQLLIEKARSMGIDANRCNIDVYSFERTATVFMDAPKVVEQIKDAA